jgi:NAD-dependent SIR2 family protein deacetylase
VSPAAVTVLLGAGSSADAGIPTSVKMTDEIIGRMEYPQHVRLLEFVRHTLAADIAQRTDVDALRGVNVDVERLFASIDLLVDRYDQPWSPFVATWHPGLESFSRAAAVRGSDLFSELNHFESTLESAFGQGWNRRGGGSVRRSLGAVIEKAFQRARPGDAGELLAVVRGEMLRSLFDLLRIDDRQRVAYLAPLINLAQTQGSLTIATLNYDRSVENAAEVAGQPYETGIETWLSRGDFDWAPDGLRLLKLHGSIDWVADNESQAGALPLQQIRKVADVEEKGYYERPAVVFGEAGKLRAEGPYLELLLAWAAALRLADTLLVIGYSFRDQHVNELIARWFNADSQRRIVVVDTNDLASQGWDTFGGRLAHVDDSPPTTTATQRLVQIVGTAKDRLAEATAAAVNHD